MQTTCTTTPVQINAECNNLTLPYKQDCGELLWLLHHCSSVQHSEHQLTCCVHVQDECTLAQLQFRQQAEIQQNNLKQWPLQDCQDNVRKSKRLLTMFNFRQYLPVMPIELLYLISVHFKLHEMILALHSSQRNITPIYSIQIQKTYDKMYSQSSSWHSTTNASCFNTILPERAV